MRGQTAESGANILPAQNISTARMPKLYPIVDAARFSSAADPVLAMGRFAGDLLTAGADLIQFRDKSANALRMLSCARELRRVTLGKARLIINDRVDICLAAGADGVHLGQDDLSAPAARMIFGQVQAHDREDRIIGFSTHNLAQVQEADAIPVDYIAVGPVFATASKDRPGPVIGLDGVRRARAATSKKLFAIGGITRKNCLQALEAGADGVAVISDLLESPVKALEEFIRLLG
jgi:thiamine-phosphate pyrophosphorylase